jgi:hypothetical protein
MQSTENTFSRQAAQNLDTARLHILPLIQLYDEKTRFGEPTGFYGLDFIASGRYDLIYNHIACPAGGPPREERTRIT